MTPSSTVDGNAESVELLMVIDPDLALRRRTCYEPLVSPHPDTQGRCALVAVERAMLIAIWHMLSTGELYHDPGPDYFTRRTPAKAKARAITQLESLGYAVELQPLKEAA